MKEDRTDQGNRSTGQVKAAEAVLTAYVQLGRALALLDRADPRRDDLDAARLAARVALDALRPPDDER